MCGRFQMTPEAWAAASRLASVPDFIEIPLGFIYPGTPAGILTAGKEGLTSRIARFGWKWNPDKRLQINARCETVWNSPLFGPWMKKDRVVIPASCFFEWTPDKEMIRCMEPGSKVLYMAGFLAENSFVIFTTAANASIRDIHHRMPLVLLPEQVAPWIQDETAARRMTQLVPPGMETAPYLFQQPRLF